MTEIYEQFLEFVSNEEKEEAVTYFLKLLDEGQNLIDLYHELLIPVMYQVDELQEIDRLTIWGEHVRSGIIRTIIECSYPYLLKIKEPTTKEKIVVLCPEQEYHELGPRMVADFFTYAGYDVTFIGANTPKLEFIHVIEEIKPEYVAIGVTNYYNIVHAKRTIQLIKENFDDLKIIVGGQAFLERDEMVYEVGADLLVNTLEDIKKLGDEL